MQGRHAPMAAPSTVPKVKRESEASASDDDIPLVRPVLLDCNWDALYPLAYIHVPVHVWDRDTIGSDLECVHVNVCVVDWVSIARFHRTCVHGTLCLVSGIQNNL